MTVRADDSAFRFRRLSFERLEDRRLLTSEQATWTQEFLTLNSQLNGGRGYSQSARLRHLGLGRKLCVKRLSGYVQGHRQQRYLDTFVSQASRVLASATDVMHNGYLGWATFNYSVNIVPNGNFTAVNSTDPHLPAGWTQFQSTDATAFLDPTQTDGSSNVVTIMTNPASGLQVLETTTDNPLVSKNQAYEPNTLYQLSFDATTNGIAGGQVVVYDATANTTLLQHLLPTEWQSYDFTFTTPKASNHKLVVELSNYQWQGITGIVSFGNVQIQQQAEYLVQMPSSPRHRVIRGRCENDPCAMAEYGHGQHLRHFYSRQYTSGMGLYRQVTPTSGVYIAPDDGSLPIPGNSLPENQNLAMGNYLWLWVADHRLNNRVRAIELANAFKATLTLDDNGQAYAWNYANPVLPGDYFIPSPASEDGSHGNIDVLFAIESYQQGIVFNATDMTRFENTFTQVMWNKASSTPFVSAYVNGTGDASYTMVLYGWANLSTLGGTNNTSWEIVDSVYDEDFASLTANGYMLDTIARSWRWLALNRLIQS